MLVLEFQAIQEAKNKMENTIKIITSETDRRFTIQFVEDAQTITGAFDDLGEPEPDATAEETDQELIFHLLQFARTR